MKVVFILHDISAQPCIKRVHEFIENGYDVEICGFDRGFQSNIGIKNVNIIGSFNSLLPYYKRLPIMVSAINSVVKHYKGENVIYYLFQLDVALAFRLCTSSKKYLYEEIDLMHTYFGITIIKRLLEKFDKYMIKRSLMSAFSSEGFLAYHYGGNYPANVYLIPNRLSKSIIDVQLIEKKKKSDILRIGFVGMLRYRSVKNFIKTFCENFPECEFYVFGKVNEKERDAFEELKKLSNYNFKGAFKNPDDLPEIYSNLDLVLATYDIDFENVRYAEPNKIYESIYFETPIIVSKNTFLEKKVFKLGIGYSVDAMDSEDIKRLVKNLKENGIDDKIESCRKIKKEDCLNVNTFFFEQLKVILNKI